MTTAQARIREWREDPCKFVHDLFGVTPDLWQEKALRAFANGDQAGLRISLEACAGPGKSAVLSWCGWNFLSCYGEPGEHPKGAAVSVTADNLRDNLWTELAKWQQRSEFLQKCFKWTKTRIHAVDHSETWFLAAKSYPKTADKETLGRTLSGIHSKYVLFLIDESGDIPVEVGKAAEQAMGETIARGGFCRIMQAGNPISLDGLLYSASVSNDWFRIKITGDPDDPMRSPRIDKEWAQQQIEKYGRDDPWVASYILGEFPKSGLNTLLGLGDVELSMTRRPMKHDYNWSQKRIGVDVARFGMDSTVLFPRQGLMAHKYSEMRHARTPEIAGRIIQAKHKWGAEIELVDGTGGYGSGVVDTLLQAGCSPFEINFSSKADSPKYYNKRAEMWFRMASWVKRGGALPLCRELKKELVAPQYSFKNGKFILEDKEQIKKRLGFSPDRADALALTFALADSPATSMEEKLLLEIDSGLKHDYDPLARSDYKPFG